MAKTIIIKLRIKLDSFCKIPNESSGLSSLKYPIKIDNRTCMEIISQQSIFFKNIDEINIVLRVYQIKGLFIPPEGINSNEFPTISIRSRILIFLCAFS